MSNRNSFSIVRAALVVMALVTAPDLAYAVEPANSASLRIAVYDVPPYGYVEPNGAIAGLSVELWRRVAEKLDRQFTLVAVSDLDVILTGLEKGRFDAAIGAITITPARAARVDFSYPAHRSGVAVATRREAGLAAAFESYARAVSEMASLIVAIVAMLLAMGVGMWFVERRRRENDRTAESSVDTLRDGLYWAVVTMTTVGYGDKTPKTNAGRMLAVGWMLGSVILISLLSTSLVSRLTAERVESGDSVSRNELMGLARAAVAHSSGAEYLDDLHLSYAKYKNLGEALAALAAKRTDAVINSVGALQYLVSRDYARRLELRPGLLAPAFMAIALGPGSALKKPIDLALLRITSDQEWISLEQRYFGN